MSPADLPLTAVLVLGIVACAGVAAYAWRRTNTPGRRLFAVGSAAACCWMLGDVIGRLSHGFGAQFAAEVVRYAGVVNVPVWLFAFTRAYCGRPLGPRALRLLFVVPAVSFGVMATSLWHRLFFRSMEVSPHGLLAQFGPYFWRVHLPYCYLLTALGIALVLIELGRVPRQFRRQILLLLVSLCVPFAMNVADMLGLLGRSYNTALSFPVFALVLSVGIFRHRLLRVHPVAYERVFQQMHDGVVILSRDDTVLDVNESAARLAGRPRVGLIGAAFGDAFSDHPGLAERLRRDRGEIAAEVTRPGDGSPSYYAASTANLLGPDQAYEGRILTLRDVTAVRQYQQSIEALAYVDPLTRLANRRRFEEETHKALRLAALRARPLAILYFDLNRFKAVNDGLGHDVGDALLTLVGARTSALLRAPDFVARLGGDEFAVLLHDTAPEALPALVARLTEDVQRPAEVHGHALAPAISLGAACYPRDGAVLPDLLRRADAAMYREKAGGVRLAG